ncbi:MAG: HAMP domain-containing sensor histidine kinase [Thermomicrobiales bacterium]
MTRHAEQPPASSASPRHSWRPPWVRADRKPPWWPPGEPWPPERPPWEANRRRMLLRIVLFVVCVLVGLMVLGWLIGSLITGSWHGTSSGSGDGPPIPVRIVFVLLVLGGIVLVIRRVRRYATPLVDVMAAADRVAGGDYAVRVEAAGSGDVQRTIAAFNAMTARLAENDDQRRQLFADIAHEVRTPLAVIQGNVEGMLDGVFPRDDVHLAPLLDEVNVLARLMADLQTLATAETGTLRLDRVPVDVRGLLDDVREAFAPQIHERGIRMEVTGDASVTTPLDPIRMRQVVDNIVANALRYTPRGGLVVLDVTALDTSVRVEVRDTGCGMPPEDAARMFDRFVKAADSGGSGLGLAIAKGIVSAHGGTIGASSLPDVGTTVWFTLPRS